MLQKLSLFLLLLLPFSGIASHLRSGEISYRPVPGSPNTYEITVTVYTNIAPGITADLASVVINFGDGTFTNPAIKRNNGPKVGGNYTGEVISPTIKKNIYTTTHKYTSNGSFTIAIAPSARNLGITNLPTGGYSLYVAAMLTVGNGITPISSPVLSMPPIGDGCIDAIYKIAPGAIDPDGDMLTFQLENCKTSSSASLNTPTAQDIKGYKYPQELDVTGRSTFTMDSKTGVIIWNKPTVQGEYNISFKIMKWRNGVMIGWVLRDMQVTIAPCANIPPIIDAVPDICVEAGTPISFKVTSSDANEDTLTFTTTGMPYDLLNSPAKYTPDSTKIGYTSGTFTWNTNASHFTRYPYQVYYKVTDSHEGSNLTDYTSNFITIIAPSVKNVNASVFKKGFNVTWDKTASATATGYNIYRKTGISPFVTDSCTIGVPPGSGFVLVGSVNSPNTLSYIDPNNGTGLTSGYTYCYVITAFFADGAESAPSQPSCSLLMYPFISVLQDTLKNNCQWSTITIDTTVIQYINANQQVKYQWSSSPNLELINPTSPNVSVRLLTPGIQTIKLIATSGLYIDSAEINIEIFPIPGPSITMKDLRGLPDSVMFYNQSTNSVRAEWTFPNGTQSANLDSVLYSFDNNGYFRIYLKVYNLLGCPDTTSTVYRAVMKGIAIPNAFEPGNTNINPDLCTFRPSALGLETYFLGIWDLWGNLVWSSDKIKDTRPAEGWDGNDSKGRKMPAQNYIWRMKATFIDGTVWEGVKDHFGKLHTEGTFNLLR